MSILFVSYDSGMYTILIRTSAVCTAEQCIYLATTKRLTVHRLEPRMECIGLEFDLGVISCVFAYSCSSLYTMVALLYKVMEGYRSFSRIIA